MLLKYEWVRKTKSGMKPFWIYYVESIKCTNKLIIKKIF